ncbi:hypothetical protein RKD35_006148 [Streptomyces albogriseolus]
MSFAEVAAPAAVLRHQHVDAVLAQQGRLVGHGERPAPQ